MKRTRYDMFGLAVIHVVAIMLSPGLSWAGEIPPPARCAEQGEKEEEIILDPEGGLGGLRPQSGDGV